MPAFVLVLEIHRDQRLRGGLIHRDLFVGSHRVPLETKVAFVNILGRFSQHDPYNLLKKTYSNLCFLGNF